MLKEVINKLISLPVSIFGPFEWNAEDFEELEIQIKFITDNFYDELNNNLFGMTQRQKYDIINEYTVSMSLNYREVFVDFSDVESSFFEGEIVFPNLKALKLIQDCYSIVNEMICQICIENSIDLKKIIDNNLVTYGIFDTSFYDNYVKESGLESGKLLTRFKNSFTGNGYQLFEFLHRNFDKRYSNHQKFSCIYRMMDKEKLIDNLKPESFRRCLLSEPYKIDTKYLLCQEGNLSKKIIAHYKELKSDFDKL